MNQSYYNARGMGDVSLYGSEQFRESLRRILLNSSTKGIRTKKKKKVNQIKNTTKKIATADVVLHLMRPNYFA